MHGDKSTPELPLFGSKVLAVMGGTIELHGAPRYPPWGEL